MGHLFISYSRSRDTDFVNWLAERLSQQERIAWVDRESIPPTDEWWSNIQSAIEDADAFVLLLSPESLESNWCRRELDHALLHRKRLIPLLRHPVDPDAVPREVAALQWISSSEATEKLVETLVHAADLDLELVRKHTHWARAARDWEARKRSPAYLLPSDMLKEYEVSMPLLDGRRAPIPTPLALEYLMASRKRVDRNQRLMLGSVLLLAVMALVAALIMFTLYQDARRQERIGTVRRLTADAQVAAKEGRLNRSVLLGRESLWRAMQEGITNPDADQVLREAMTRMALPISGTHLGQKVEHVKLSADGTLLFAHSWHGKDDRFEVVDVVNDRVRISRPLNSGIKRILDVTFQGHTALWLTENRDARAEQWLFSWSEATPGEVESLPVPSKQGHFWLNFTFSSDGQFLAGIDNYFQVVVWRVRTQPLGVETLVQANCTSQVGSTSLAFSPDNRQLAIAIGDRVLLLGPKGDQPFHAWWLVYGGAGNSAQAGHLAFSKNGRWLGAILSHPQSVVHVGIGYVFHSNPDEQAFHLWALPEEEGLQVRHVGSWSELWGAAVRDIHISDSGETVLLSNRRGREEVYRLDWSQTSLIGHALLESVFWEGASPIQLDGSGWGLGLQQSRILQGGASFITVGSFGISQWERDAQRETLHIEEPSVFSAFDTVPDLGLWATGTEEGQVRVWKTHTGLRQGGALLHHGEVRQIVSSPDGGVLVASGLNDVGGVLGIWRLLGDASNERETPRDFTMEELTGDPVLAIDPGNPEALLLGDSQGLHRIRLTPPTDGGTLPQELLEPWPVLALAEDCSATTTPPHQRQLHLPILSDGSRR